MTTTLLQIALQQNPCQPPQNSMVTAAKAVMTNHNLHNHNNNNNNTTTNSFAATPLPTPKFNGLSLSAVLDIETLAQKAGNNACRKLRFLSNALPNVHWGGCILCSRFSKWSLERSYPWGFPCWTGSGACSSSIPMELLLGILGVL
jgi:hypothetical protein